MNAIEHRLNLAVKQVLTDHRPEGVPQTMEVRAAQDITRVSRPFIVASTENVTSTHPSLRTGTLFLITHSRVDDPNTKPMAEIHQRFVDALVANFDALQTLLVSQQLRIIKFVPGPTSEEIDPERGAAHSTAWSLWIRILPAESTP